MILEEGKHEKEVLGEKEKKREKLYTRTLCLVRLIVHEGEKVEECASL